MTEINRGIGLTELSKLKAFFSEDDLEWRVQMCGKNNDNNYWVLLVPYMNRRAVMDRLDFVCSPENWKDDYVPGPDGGVMCRLSIRINGEWITKCDAAENTNIESIKGGISDALKRAASKWGIGRYLSQLPRMYAIIDKNGPEYTYYKPQQGNREHIKYRNPPVPVEWLPPVMENEVVKRLRVEIDAILKEIPGDTLSPKKSIWLEKKLQTGFTEGEARRTLAGLKKLKNIPSQNKTVEGTSPYNKQDGGNSAESEYI